MARLTNQSDLPPDWEAKEVNGRLVYINHRTKHSQWEKPTGDPHAMAGADVRPVHARVVDAQVAPLGAPARTRVATGNSKEAPQRDAPAYASLPRHSPEDSGRTEASEPLPAGWESQMIGGVMVYMDRLNKVSTYSKPTTPAQGYVPRARTQTSDSVASADGGPAGLGVTGSFDSNRSTASSHEEPLPQGWTKQTTKEGVPVYINHNDKTTSWTRPTASPAAAPRATPEHPTSGGRHGQPVERVVRVASDLSGASSSVHGSVAGGDGEEAPLPQGWSKGKTKTGEVYYMNHKLQTTSWERPAAPTTPAFVPALLASPLASPQTTAVPPRHPPHVERVRVASDVSGASGSVHGSVTGGDGDEAPLPQGWSKGTTKTGEVYYMNHERQTTSWERPPAPTIPAPVHAPLASPQTTVAPSPYHSQGGAVRVESGEPPLPPGWKKSTTKTGEVYYVNDQLEATSWERPPAPSTPVPRAVPAPAPVQAPLASPQTTVASSSFHSNGSAVSAGGGEPPLPEGWKKGKTKAGEVYYINDELKTTSWERPPAPTTPVARVVTVATPVPAPLASPQTTVTPSYHSNGSAVSSGGGEPPLPEGWKKSKTNTGEVYYINDQLKTTSWGRPAAATTPAPVAVPVPAPVHAPPASPQTTVAQSSYHSNGSATSAGGGEPPLPQGWSKCVTSMGEVYYENHTDKTTSWTRPAAPIAFFPALKPECVPPRVTAPAPSVGGPPQPLPSGTSDQSSPSVGDRGAAAAAAAVEAPLPPGWTQLATPTGDVYYENHVTKSTTWTRPVAATATSPNPANATGASLRRHSASEVVVEYPTIDKADDAEAPLLDGWTMRTMKTGQVYYENDADKRKSWTKPVAPPQPPGSAATRTKHRVTKSNPAPALPARGVPPALPARPGARPRPAPGGAGGASPAQAPAPAPAPAARTVVVASQGSEPPPPSYNVHVQRRASMSTPAAASSYQMPVSHSVGYIQPPPAPVYAPPATQYADAPPVYHEHVAQSQSQGNLHLHHVNHPPPPPAAASGGGAGPASTFGSLMAAGIGMMGLGDNDDGGKKTKEVEKGKNVFNFNINLGGSGSESESGGIDVDAGEVVEEVADGVVEGVAEAVSFLFG